MPEDKTPSTQPAALELADLRRLNPRPAKRVAELTAAERQRRAEYEKLRKRRQREVARRNRGHWRGYVGKDFLKEIQAIQAEGFSPAAAFAEFQRRLEVAERELAAERLARQQAEDKAHNLRLRFDPAYRAQRGTR